MERERTWADSILEHYESGIDVTQIDQNLALTPEQRLDELQRLVTFFAECGRAREARDGHRFSPPAASPR